MRGIVVLATAMVVEACENPLPAWDPHAGSADGGAPIDAAREPRLSFDPPAERDAVTRVTRIRVDLGRALASPRVLLIEGVLTSAQLHDLARPTVAQTLSARAQAALVWSPSETALVVAPLEKLAAGTLYTVGVSDPPLALSFTIAADDRTLLLPHVWPDPTEGAMAATAAVWCGSDALVVEDRAVILAPAESEGLLAGGTGTTVLAASCVSWFGLVSARPDPLSLLSPALPPAWVPLAGGAIALLEPALLWPDARPPAPSPAVCESIEVQFGPGCARVEDDRITVRPPEGPVLWTIETGLLTIVRRSRAARSFVVRPLPANARFRFATLDESGRPREDDVTVQPAPPMAHVVLNEVMANPAGAEPKQEWMELFNDGSSPVAIGGYGLETGGGTAILPPAVLAPGAFALVVSDAYEENDGVDPVPAPGTLIMRVPALGRDGLSNEGERLVLRDLQGAVVSTFPPMKTKNGISNARIAPDAVDAYPDSFAPSANGTATPGAPNAAP